MGSFLYSGSAVYRKLSMWVARGNFASKIQKREFEDEQVPDQRS